MPVSWRDRVVHLRSLWRMPNTLHGDIATASAKLEGLRADVADVQARLEVLTTERRVAAEQQRVDTYRVIEGAAASTLQLLGPRLDILNRLIEEVAAAAPVANLQKYLADWQSASLRHTQRLEDLAFDLLALSALPAASLQTVASHLSLRTDHPVAVESADHLQPRGTAQDDTRHPRFVAACERHFPRQQLRHLDLGCAGGGLVWDFLLAGHTSYGIEGSDYSQRNRRAYWRVVPKNLFTADITQPFQLVDRTGAPQNFDVITAWEVLEHIPDETLDGTFGNVARCLRSGGIFVASVATFPDEDPETGTRWHVTIQPREWWLERAAAHGLHEAKLAGRFEFDDFPRGSGNPRAHDWDARRNPELGFHLVLER